MNCLAATHRGAHSRTLPGGSRLNGWGCALDAHPWRSFNGSPLKMEQFVMPMVVFVGPTDKGDDQNR